MSETISIQSFAYPGRYIRHRNWLGELTPVRSDLDRHDATFTMVPGLADNAGISFESVNYPGYYLRHQDFRLKLQKRTGDSLFDHDATFMKVAGLAHPKDCSFKSVNYPDRYIRHKNYHLWLESGSSNWFRRTATFRMVPALVSEHALLDDYISGLPKIPYLPDGATTGPSSTQSVTDPDGSQWTETSTPMHQTRAFDEVVALDALSDAVWPGAILQGRSLISSAPAPIGLKRSPVTITVTGLTAATSGVRLSKQVVSPSLGSIEQAISDLLQQKFNSKQAADMQVYAQQTYSFEHAMLSIGVNVSWLTGSVKASLQGSFTNENQSYVISVTQRYYSVSSEAPSSPASFLASSVGVEDLKRYTGADNPPVYVSTVSYGRRLVLMAQTTKKQRDLSAQLQVSAGNVSVNSSFSMSELLKNSTITALVLGGSGTAAAQLIGTFVGSDTDKMKALDAYLRDGANWSVNSPGVPIGYTVRYLCDNSLATQSFTTDYTKRDYVPVDIQIQWLTLDIQTEDDDKDDSAGLWIQFTFDSQIVAEQTNVGYGTTWDDNTQQTLRFDLNRPVSLDAVLAAGSDRPDPDNPRGLWMKIREEHDNTGWRMSYQVQAHCSDGSNRTIGRGGKYILFDADQPCVYDRMDLSSNKPSNKTTGDGWVC